MPPDATVRSPRRLLLPGVSATPRVVPAVLLTVRLPYWMAVLFGSVCATEPEKSQVIVVSEITVPTLRNGVAALLMTIVAVVPALKESVLPFRSITLRFQVPEPVHCVDWRLKMVARFPGPKL